MFSRRRRKRIIHAYRSTNNANLNSQERLLQNALRLNVSRLCGLCSGENASNSADATLYITRRDRSRDVKRRKRNGQVKSAERKASASSEFNKVLSLINEGDLLVTPRNLLFGHRSNDSK